MNTHLYDKIAVSVAMAIETGIAMHDARQTKHRGHLVEKVAKDIMTTFKEELPELIDIQSKWEVREEDGIHITITNHEAIDRRALAHLAKFGADQGRNEVLKKIHEDVTIPTPKKRKPVILG